MGLDRRAERLLAMLTATSGSARETPAARRAALVALAQTADHREAPANTEDRLIEGPGGPLALRLYSPIRAAGGLLPGLVFFHGGGWVAGDLETHDGLCRRLSEAAGVRVIAVDYRLAPEHPFPAGLADCLTAFHWIGRHAHLLGLDPDRLAVAGDSAGASLAAAVAGIVRDNGGPAIALQLLICPILDVARQGGSRETFGEGHFISKAAFARDLADYLPPGTEEDDPRHSPLRAESLAGLPPAIIHTAAFDPFRDEGEAFADALEAAGVSASVTRHAGMIHYFYALARALPYAEAAAAVIGAQLKAALGTSVRATNVRREDTGERRTTAA
jgi:acetyl esterase